MTTHALSLLTRTLVGASLCSLVSIAAAQPELPAPFEAGPSQDGVRVLTVDRAAGERLEQSKGIVRLLGFPMPHGGSADLLIERFEVLTPDAPVVIGDPRGDFEMGHPDVALFRGSIEGVPGSAVFLSLSPHGTHGVLRTDASTAIVTSGPVGAGLDTVVADIAAFPEPPEFARGWSCNIGPEHINPLGLDLGDAADQGQDVTGNNPCRIVRVAVDSDFEYTDRLFGGSVEASAAYAVTIIGAVGEIYTRDLNVRLMVPFVRVWAEDNDPYSGGSLDAFRNEWNANMRNVDRDLAHKLSGAYGGGVAWVSVLCNRGYGYGLSGVNGSFPYPLRDHHGGNWDPFVVAHELGHNFGTLHTHDGYDPVIDGCGNGDCSDAYGGTIMSYCHLCSGGMNNIRLGFHPRVITRVSDYMNSVCDLTGAGRVFAYDDETTTLQGQAVTVDVLANDVPINCGGLEIVEFTAGSQFGGTVELSQGTGEGGRDELRYTPAAGHMGSDLFFYTIQNDDGTRTSADVRVDVIELRSADALGTSRPGLAADYFALQAPDQLPDFDTLSPYLSTVEPDLNIASRMGLFGNSGRAVDLGAVFEAAVLVPETGIYTLSIESDDGSRLFVGDELLIDNDGLHGMVERSGDIGLEAGPHRIRVEYFQQAGQRGLITRIEGPGVARQPIPEAMWRFDRCVADWSLDGEVNTLDFLLFLADWNLRAPQADTNADGLVDSRDVVAYLNAWIEGC